MRYLLGFLTTISAVTIRTTASEASVFTFGSETQRQDVKPSVISSAGLKQLLELRFKSSTASTLDGSNENIDFLGSSAGPPIRLFGTSVADEDLDTIMVVLEGLSDDIESEIRAEYQNQLVTSTFATSSKRDAFIDHLLESRADGIVSPESKHCSVYGDENIDSEAQKGLVKSCLPKNFDLQSLGRTLNVDLLNNGSPGEIWINERKGTMVVHIAFKPLSGYLNNLKSLFSSLHSLSLNNKWATAIVLSDSNTMRRSTHTRRAQESTKIDSNFSLDHDAQFMTPGQQATVPLSFTSVCYASNSSCNEATNTCSGHGACYKKSGDCYACRCSESYVETGVGVGRKARWEGSACQKQDISSPFFLVTGVSLALVVAISAAVGMIFRVGDTELPGVISAGVGASRGQR
ncbi:hypothetical protein BDW62DRAFT_195239 [Aspergillus aurantiobrunneus]